MRPLPVVALLVACGCSRQASSSAEADTAAVYEAFIEYYEADFNAPVLLPDSAAPVTAAMFDDGSGMAPGEMAPGFSAEVREAVRHLVARGPSPGLLPAELEVADGQSRISPDSVTALLELVSADNRRLPDSASIVEISAVGFSRDRTVAVVYHGVACGWLCGGGAARVFRKHPLGWLPAEELFRVHS